ncbi:MAG: tape measure protein, partial [Tannerellaceae bacterium]
MAKLVFKVAADYEKVIRLREEIDKLTVSLQKIDVTKNKMQAKELEKQLSQASKEYNDLVSNAAQAGTSIDAGFKKSSTSLLSAQKNVDAITSRVITQKQVVVDLQSEIRRLNAAYSVAQGNDKNNIKNKIVSNKKLLEQERISLNNLRSEQDRAKLSVKGLKDEVSSYERTIKNSVIAQDKANSSFGGMAKAFALVGGTAAISGLMNKVVETRAQFESIERSYEVLLGSQEKATKKIAELKEYAIISPLTFTDLSDATKTLLGFNVEADRLMPILKALGDVSMGESGKFGSLSLAFAQMSAAGRLMGQDLNQMINAGFNPLQEISKTTGKSIGTLKDEMSKGAISAEMVEKAFISATSAGGKFFGMAEKGADGIKSAQSNLENAISELMNSFGKDNQDIIKGAYNSTTLLVQNYDKIGKAILSIVATYGVYKASLITIAALEKGYTIAQLAQYRALLLTEKAQKLLNATMLKNPYVLCATLVVGLATAMWALSESTSKAEKTQDRLNNKLNDIINTSEKRKEDSKSLVGVIKDETQAETDRLLAFQKLIDIYPGIFGNMDIEKVKAMELTSAYKLLNEEESKRLGAEKQKELNSLYRQKETLENSIKGDLNTPGLKYQNRANETKAVLDKVNGQIEKLEKEKAEFFKIKSNSTKSPDVENKSFWEKEKKDAEALLEALDVKKKGSKEWIALEEKIQNADKEISKYSLSKNEKYPKVKIDDQKKELESFLRTKGFETAQMEIDIMQEGTDKKLVQMKFNHEKELALLEIQKQERLDKNISNQKALFESDPANKGKSFKASGVKLSSEEEAVFSSAESVIKKRQLNEEAVFFQGVLDQYKTYTEQRIDIQRKFQQDRDILTKQGASKEKQDELNLKESDAISALNQQFSQRSIDFQLWMDSVTDLAIDSLVVALQEAENALTVARLKSKADGTDGSELRELEEKARVLKEQVKAEKSNNKAGNDNGQIKRSVKEWQSLYKTLNKVNGSFEEIGDSVGGVAGEIIKSAGSIVSATLQGVDGIVTLVNSSTSAVKGTSEVAAKSISTVEKASIILAVISAALQVAMKIASLFSKDRELSQKTIDQYESYMDTVDKVIEKNNELMESLSGSAAESAAKKSEDLINRQIEATRKLGIEFLNSRKKGEHSYGYKVVKALKPYGEQLKQYGYDPQHAESLFRMSSDQLARMKDEQLDIWMKLDADTRKYLETIIECGEALEKLPDQASEAFTGVSFDSVKNEFLDMLYDMESSTEDF